MAYCWGVMIVMVGAGAGAGAGAGTGAGPLGDIEDPMPGAPPPPQPAVAKVLSESMVSFKAVSDDLTR